MYDSTCNHISITHHIECMQNMCSIHISFSLCKVFTAITLSFWVSRAGSWTVISSLSCFPSFHGLTVTTWTARPFTSNNSLGAIVCSAWGHLWEKSVCGTNSLFTASVSPICSVRWLKTKTLELVITPQSIRCTLVSRWSKTQSTLLFSMPQSTWQS